MVSHPTLCRSLVVIALHTAGIHIYRVEDARIACSPAVTRTLVRILALEPSTSTAVHAVPVIVIVGKQTALEGVVLDRCEGIDIANRACFGGGSEECRQNGDGRRNDGEVHIGVCGS
jgi:hypothetical protein